MRDADRRIREIAAGQHGAAARAQLCVAGVSQHVLDRRLRTGSLAPVHRGVYRLTDYEPTAWTYAMAAVLATRGRDAGGAVISHTSAAMLWDCPDREAAALLHVTSRHRRRLPGVYVHRSALDPGETTRLRGVPVTTPTRTLLDVAAVATSRELEQALAAAERRDSACLTQVRGLLERRLNHPGSRRLRNLLAALEQGGRRPLFLRSRAEELALAMLRRSRAPEPLANVRIAGFEVDFVWSDERIILEVDGYEFHGSPAAFHRDRERDRALAAAGYQVLRFTWRQLSTEPEACLGALCIALGRRMR